MKPDLLKKIFEELSNFRHVELDDLVDVELAIPYNPHPQENDTVLNTMYEVASSRGWSFGTQSNLRYSSMMGRHPIHGVIRIEFDRRATVNNSNTIKLAFLALMKMQENGVV